MPVERSSVDKHGECVGGLVFGWSVGGGVVRGARCGAMWAAYSGVSWSYLSDNTLLRRRYSCFFHKTNLAQRAIARGRTGGALAMSYAAHRHTHLGLLAVYN